MQRREQEDVVVTHSLFTPGDGSGDQAVVDIYRIADGHIVEHWDVKEPVPQTTASGHPIV